MEIYNIILAICSIGLLVRLMLQRRKSIVKQHQNNTEEIFKMLNSISQNQHAFYTFAEKRLSFNALASQWQLASIRPYIVRLHNEALKQDMFEAAEKYQRIIKSIDELVEYQFK